MGRIFTFLVLCTNFLYCFCADDCVKINSCSCKNSKGTVDLSPLALSGGDAKFLDQGPAGNYYYSWNPCNPFTETDNCKSVSGCQTDKKTIQFPIGTQDTAKFANDAKKGLYISYSAPGGQGTTRKLDVFLVCDEKVESSMAVKGEDPPGSGTYEMTLTSKYACPGVGPGPSGGGGALQAGSILVIAFFSLIIVYFIAGILFQKFVRKASGKEMAPNLGFWSALPGLIKDGVLFTVKCGKTGDAYAKI